MISDKVIKKLINRRFVRIEVLIKLYSYYLARNATYTCALEQISGFFVLNRYEDNLKSTTSITEEKANAINFFINNIKTSNYITIGIDGDNLKAIQVVNGALIFYRKEVLEEIKKAHLGLTEIENNINQAYLLILQLLIEWSNMSEEIFENPSYRSFISNYKPISLHKNVILTQLSSCEELNKHAIKINAIWKQNIDIVDNWFHKFIENDTTLVDINLSCPLQILQNIINNVIFKVGVIQDFFSDKYLNWLFFKEIVWSMLNATIISAFNKFKSNDESKFFKLFEIDLEVKKFYTSLIQITLDNDDSLESILKEKVENWTVDRIVLLDRVILKLALCEMKYFKTIPVNVSINEYISISKIFSTAQSGKFINGILDSVSESITN